MDTSWMFTFIKIITGVLLLTTGRKLVWLVIGLAGFVAGMAAAQYFLGDQSGWVILGAGIVGGFLSIFLLKVIKSLTLGLAGLLLGAYLINGLLSMLKLDLGVLNWVLILMGGALCAFLMLSAFELALKLITSFAGAMLITQLVPQSFAYTQILFIALVILGVIIQSRKKHQASE